MADKPKFPMFSCLLTSLVVAFFAVVGYEKIFDKDFDCTVQDEVSVAE